MNFIFSMRNCCMKKKDIRNILLLQTNDKYKVVKRKTVVGYDSIVFLVFFRTQSGSSPNLFFHIHTYICRPSADSFLLRGRNFFQNRAPLKAFETTAFRKRSRLQY